MPNRLYQPNSFSPNDFALLVVMIQTHSPFTFSTTLHLHPFIIIIIIISEISCEYLTKIWNEQIIMQKNFPNELKLADITPILKRYNSTLAKNYRPVSALPCISKIFE